MIKQISKQEEEFNKKAKHPLQSWEWGEFRKEWGNDVVRTDFGQVIFSKISKTNFSIGTLIKGPRPDKKQLEGLKKIGKEKNAIFIKLEPNEPNDPVSLGGYDPVRIFRFLKSNGCIPGKTLFTSSTFWIDLTKSETKLLKSFFSKTRYNIRLAQRKGVNVVEDNSDKAFEKYIQLTRETVERQGFYAHTENYHRLMWEHLHKKPMAESRQPIARLLTARYNGEIITTWVIFVWHDFLYYPYGASTEKYKNLMANNLMMWEAIRYGKALGLKTFDLWGREPGKGFTKFKEGYNPRVVEFLGTWDLVINKPLYQIYRVAENIRWSLLRLKSKILKPTF